MAMADDFFADFTFNSTTFPSVSAPMASDSFDEDDAEWGDFVTTGSDQINGQEPPSWVKPLGALPLSLFGEPEEDKPVSADSVLDYVRPILFSDDKKKDNSSSFNGGFGISDLIADLYGQSEKMNVQNGSAADSKSDWNQNGFDNADSSFSNLDSGVNGLNSNSNGLSSDLVHQSENSDHDDDDDYGWEFKGADGNDLEYQTVEAPKLKGKDGEIQVDGDGRIEVEESKAATESSNGLPGSVHKSLQSSNTSNGVSNWNFALDFNTSTVNNNDILWDSNSAASKENIDTKIGSSFYPVAENGNSNDNFWQFEDPFSRIGAGTKPQFEAAKVSASTDLVIQTVNGGGARAPTDFFVQSEETFHRPEHGGGARAPTDFFVQSEETFHRPEQGDLGFSFQSSSAQEEGFKWKQDDTGEGLSTSQDDKDEFEEEDWEFRDAYSETGSKNEIQEDSKVSPNPPTIETSPGLNGATQGSEIKVGRDREALPLSLFGDEELETDAFPANQDVSVHTFTTTFTTNTNSNSSSNLSINDLLSSLYSQAEQSTSVCDAPKEYENEPHSVVRPEESDIVSPDDDFGDDSWEFKDAPVAKAQYETFVASVVESPMDSSTKLQLDQLIDFYSRLKDESCLVTLNHLETLKNAQNTSIEALGDDFQRFYDQLSRDNMLPELQLDNLSQRSSGICEFLQILHEPNFSVIDSEFHLSNLLSLAEKDLDSAVKLSKHATATLQILKLGSADEQHMYVSIWSKILSVCAQKLKHGAFIWDQASQKSIVGQILYELRGREYVIALGEIYRVVQVIGASIKLYKPWVLLNPEGPSFLYGLLNECTSLWFTSGLNEALQSISQQTDLLGSIQHIQNLDALSLHHCVFSGKELLCRLSMLTPGIVPGIKLVIWDGDQYLLKVANLWANEISFNPPELPKLNIS